MITYNSMKCNANIGPCSNKLTPPLHTHTHTHTHHTGASSYVLNDRLFPVPVHHCSDPLSSHCPVCEGKHKSKPSPTRYVRCATCTCLLLLISFLSHYLLISTTFPPPASPLLPSPPPSLPLSHAQGECPPLLSTRSL